MKLMKWGIYMIDTINLKYRFPNLSHYNECYRVMDDMPAMESDYKCRLHKTEDKKKHYITTAFYKQGFLDIAFDKDKTHNRYTITLFFKPVIMVRGTCEFNLSLASEASYDTMEKRFNEFIERINKQADIPYLLPPLYLWSVNRVDYAYDIWEDSIKEYIVLFKHGMIPPNFTYHDYPTSFYLTSKECNINFYDKTQQLRDKDIEFGNEAYEETGDHLMWGESILRLEVQCKTRKLSHIKEDFRLPDRTLKSFWSEKIAYTVLMNYIKKIIGKEDVFPYNKCIDKLREKYPKRRTMMSKCIQILDALKEHPELSLGDIYALHPREYKKYVHMMRQAGINPIPLEVTLSEGEVLYNPYESLEELLCFL